MGLPIELDCRYILESWKKITANVIATINAPIKLQMVFYRWYAIFINGYTDEQIKILMALHRVFLSVMC